MLLFFSTSVKVYYECFFNIYIMLLFVSILVKKAYIVPLHI